MSYERSAILCLVLCLSACNPAPTGGTDAGTGGSDTGSSGASIVGTWGTTACLGTEYTSCDNELTFAADGTYTNSAVGVKDPAAGTGFDGCTITRLASGFTWAATATTVSVAAGPSPAGTVERASCIDPADDLAISPNPDFAVVSYTFTDLPYTISGNELTLGGPGGLVLTRR